MSCLDTLMIDVMAVTPGADKDYVKNLVLRTIAEFFTVSGAWVEVIGPVRARPGLKEYLLEPRGGMITHMTKLYYNETEIPFKQFPAAQSPIPWDDDERFRGPMGYGIRPDLLALYSPEHHEMGDTFTVVVTKTTCRDATKFPPEVATTWYETIYDGIIGRMYSMPKKPWSNPQMSVYHLRRFRNGMAAARNAQRHNFTSAESNFRFPAWA